MNIINRRDFLKQATVAGAAMSLPFSLQAASEKMATRPIPSTGQPIGIVGYGNTPVFFQESDENQIQARELIKILLGHGGNFIDTNAQTLWHFEKWLDKETLSHLHLDSSIAEYGPTISDRDIDHLHQALNKKPLDMVKIRNMSSLAAMKHWPMLKEWKAAGIVRHIGVSGVRTSQIDTVNMLEEVMDDGADFVQFNYSILEDYAEQRVLPAARDKGVAVFTNRPYINGNYFKLVNGRQLPDWVKEFDCESWAQLSAKWILSHPAVTCVITESGKTHHAIDNLRSGFGKLPDKDQRIKISQLIKSFA